MRATVLTIQWDDEVGSDPGLVADYSRAAAETLSKWFHVNAVNMKVVSGVENTQQALLVAARPPGRVGYPRTSDGADGP